MRVTSRSSGHGSVAATSEQAGTSSNCGTSHCSPSRPSDRAVDAEKAQLEPSSPVALAPRPPASTTPPLPAQEPEPAWLPVVCVIQYTTYVSLTAACRATVATQQIWKTSCLPGLSPGRLNLLSCAILSLGSGLQSLLDTRAGCCPALGQGTTFVRRPSEGPSATLMQADIGTTRKEGAYNSTGYFPPRYRSQEARDQAPCTPLDCRSSTTGLGNRLFLI